LLGRARIFLLARARSLEDASQAELQDARAVHSPRLEEVAASEASSARGKPRATSCAALVATQRTPRRAIKAGEGFRSELEGRPLCDGEMLEQRHIDVPMAGIAQEITP